MKKFILNGEWQLTHSSIDKPEEKWGRWIPAKVPGDVHLDLMNAGLICEPLVSDNSTKYHWVEQKYWWYQQKFHISEKFIQKRVELVCEGLDLTAEIWLNKSEAKRS